MIENLEEKLLGKIPVAKLELLKLVDSWGRKESNNKNENLIIRNNIKVNECYDLSKLDVSKIKNFSYIFSNSLFNGDISKWDVSKATKMEYLFHRSDFDGDISNWNIPDDCYLTLMFYNAENFKKKYNDGYGISDDTMTIRNWLIENKEYMKSLNLSNESKIEIDTYLNSFDKNLELNI